jgi:hypothetical protein
MKAGWLVLAVSFLGAGVLNLLPSGPAQAQRAGSIIVEHTACRLATGPTAWEGYPGFQRRRELSGADNCMTMTRGTRGVFTVVDDGTPCFFLAGRIGECWFVPVEALDFEDPADPT